MVKVNKKAATQATAAKEPAPTTKKGSKTTKTAAKTAKAAASNAGNASPSKEVAKDTVKASKGAEGKAKAAAEKTKAVVWTYEKAKPFFCKVTDTLDAAGLEEKKKFGGRMITALNKEKGTKAAAEFAKYLKDAAKLRVLHSIASETELPEKYRYDTLGWLAKGKVTVLLALEDTALKWVQGQLQGDAEALSASNIYNGAYSEFYTGGKPTLSPKVAKEKFVAAFNAMYSVPVNQKFVVEVFTGEPGFEGLLQEFKTNMAVA